jgi:hypothetical protein
VSPLGLRSSFSLISLRSSCTTLLEVAGAAGDGSTVGGSVIVIVVMVVTGCKNVSSWTRVIFLTCLVVRCQLYEVTLQQ